MSTRRRVASTLCAVLLAAHVGSAAAEPAPEKLALTLVMIFEAPQPRFLFVIGSVGFTTVASLEAFLATQPAGTELTWAPGCERIGGEPLLSSEADMDGFRHFMIEHGIKFTLIPAG